MPQYQVAISSLVQCLTLSSGSKLTQAWLHDRAASASRSEAVRVLVEELKAPKEARDNNGATPLFVAAASGEKDIALYLISQGANVEVSS